MAASPKEKFDAAVKIIHSLPKDGAFQPSHGMMLKFYAYYKQATLGKCNISRPAFWDIVGKAKWDAWNRLGDMPQEQAMTRYVEGLKKVLEKQYPNGYDRQEIVEAMPHTAMVQDFVQKLDNFYELMDDKPKPNGDAVIVSNGSGVDMLETNLRENTDPETIRDTEVEATVQDTLPVATKKVGGPDFDGGDNNEEKGEEGSGNGENNSPDLHRQPSSSEASPSSSESSVRPFFQNESDSEVEEFCDTTDSPQSQRRLNLNEVEEDREARYSPPPRDVHRDVSSFQPEMSSLLNSRSSTALFPGQSMNESGFVEATSLMERTQSSVFTGLDDRTSSYADFTNRNWRGKSARGAGEGGTAGPTQHPAPSVSGQYSGGRSQLLQTGAGSGGGWGSGGSGGASGGSGGSGEGPSRAPPSQEIAVALLRLQEDMNSVLARMNTLEALTVAQTQLRSRQNSGSSRAGSWWPLSLARYRNWFFILVWPFIVHWLIVFISRRRNRRR